MYPRIVLGFFLLLKMVELGNASRPSYFLENEVESHFDPREELMIHRYLPILTTLARQKIENTADVITFFSSYQTDEANPVLDTVIEVLRMSAVERSVDRVLKKYPDFPSIVRGIRLFLTGPEAKPLIDALKTVIVPLAKALTTLYEKIREPLEETGMVFAEEGIKLYILLQSPPVIEVIQKFQKLPEVLQLAEHLKIYDIQLMEGLKDLENLLK